MKSKNCQDERETAQNVADVFIGALDMALSDPNAKTTGWINAIHYFISDLAIQPSLKTDDKVAILSALEDVLELAITHHYLDIYAHQHFVHAISEAVRIKTTIKESHK